MVKRRRFVQGGIFQSDTYLNLTRREGQNKTHPSEYKPGENSPGFLLKKLDISYYIGYDEYRTKRG
jgi:hypothetical protein